MLATDGTQVSELVCCDGRAVDQSLHVQHHLLDVPIVHVLVPLEVEKSVLALDVEVVSPLQVYRLSLACHRARRINLAVLGLAQVEVAVADHG